MRNEKQYLEDRMRQVLTTAMVVYVCNSGRTIESCKKTAKADDRKTIIKEAAKKLNELDFQLSTLECLRLAAIGAERLGVSPCVGSIETRFELCLETAFDKVHKDIFKK